MRLDEMLPAAEMMASSRDHLRVDFYEVQGRLWFGECCLFPGSGLDRFEPASLDAKFGELWTQARLAAEQPQESSNTDSVHPSASALCGS